MAERAKPEGQGKPVELKTLIDRFRENEQELKVSRTAGSSNAASATANSSAGGQRSGPKLRNAKCPGCLRIHPVNAEAWWENCWKYIAVFHPEHSRQGFVVSPQAKNRLEKWLRENPSQVAKATVSHLFHYYVDNVANAANPSLLSVESKF